MVVGSLEVPPNVVEAELRMLPNVVETELRTLPNVVVGRFEVLHDNMIKRLWREDLALSDAGADDRDLQ